MRGHSAILHHLRSELMHVLFPILSFYHLQNLPRQTALFPLSSELYCPTMSYVPYMFRKEGSKQARGALAMVVVVS